MKKIVLAIGLFLVKFMFVGCNGNSSTTLSTNGNDDNSKVLVYMSGPEVMINSLESTFEETHGDVLDITILSCGQLRDKVWTESQSGEIEADIFFGSDPILFNKLDDQNKLEELSLTEFDMISSSYKVNEHNYAFVVDRYIVMMATSDSNRLSVIPDSYEDLKDDIYKGKISMADASLSATAFAIASAIYDLKGRSMNYFENLSNNSLILSKSNGNVPSGILDGTYDLGIAPHDSYIRLKKKAVKDGYDLNLTMIWPSEGAIAIQRPIAISKKASRSEEKLNICNDFVNFLLSKQGQTIQYNNGFVSVRTDIENTYLPNSVTVKSIDWEYAASHEAEFKTAYDDLFKS